MFLISEKGKVLDTDLSDLADFTLRATYTPLAMYAPSVVYISLNQLNLNSIYRPRKCLGIRICSDLTDSTLRKISMP